MEVILDLRVTPIIKSLSLLLIIFTAKVLTSRPIDTDDSKNNIQHQKPSHYVRTFTKYHHLRTQYYHTTEENILPQKHNVNIFKRDLRKLLSEDSSDSVSNNIGGTEVKANGKHSKAEVKKFKVKAAIIVTDAPTTVGPTISCIYRTSNITMSSTPSYEDDDHDKNTQEIMENDHFVVPGPLSFKTFPNGVVEVIEKCTDSRASCYTFWHEDDDGIVTILGQGCWRASQKTGRYGCDSCSRVSTSMKSTSFCCCAEDYCNAHFGETERDVVTPKAELTMDTHSQKTHYANLSISILVAIILVLIIAIILKRIYCNRTALNKDEISDGIDIEKVDIMGTGPEALATGLICVDNLTLIEHIGQGKFGSVWRGSLGSNSVAVKLYSNANTWQKEAAIYALPHLSHPNILKYYGSDTRPSLTEGGSRDHLIVLELCSMTLRKRLEISPLTWQEFATLAHGLSAALAHLHSVSGHKPCIVHRDVHSANVLVAPDGSARLADLGLAQLVRARPAPPPTSLAEAGTLRYLAPEALEGALDLSGARAALCAVDVFAMGLVLWEMLWRCSGAHAHSAPPYSPPYHLHLDRAPTLALMQNLVSRNKVRPVLPKGPVQEWRALKIATDTCDECWDHDAEARLTAVCVEERMAELKQMLHAHGPVIHDNNLHPHSDNNPPPPESDKNSNCVATQNCDVTTPLLYTHPHIGRNPCLERNTHTNTQTHAVELIHKSLKDITIPSNDSPRLQNIDDNCLSVARISSQNRIQSHINDMENSDRLNEIRSYQRPLEYVQNDVNAIEIENRGPKQTNLLHNVKVEKPKWGIRRFFERKLQKNAKPLETEVKLLPDILSNASSGQNVARTITSIVNEKANPNDRPTNLVLTPDIHYNFEGPCTLSPPNRTLSPTMLMESEMNKSENKVFGFKEIPNRNGEELGPKPNQIFAVIVPKAKTEYANLIDTRKKNGSSDSLNKSLKTSMSSQSLYIAGSAGNSESEDSTFKKRLSCDNKIITNITNSGCSSRASINLELQYINHEHANEIDSPFDVNSDCSSSEDEHLMLLSENGGSKITMQTIPKAVEAVDNKKRSQNDVLKESSQKTDFSFANKFNPKYKNFDNEFSDSNDKENVGDLYSGDNPVYLAALNGEIEIDLKCQPKISISVDKDSECPPKSPKPSLKNLTIKRQRSLEQVSEIFSSSGDINLQNPAGRVKTPGDLPAAVRKARRDRALQKGRANESNRLSLYDDRMMFGNSL